MTWLTWRLHRKEAAIGILLFAGLIATMFYGMQSVENARDAARDGGCFGTQSLRCSELLTEYLDRTSSWDMLTTLLYGVPIAVAALEAIPTLHELERGTHRLAWTQSISRRRWTLVRIAFVAGIAALVAAIWALVALRWRDSIMEAGARSFGQTAFDFSPAVLIGYSLFAVALVLGAGVVVRRLVPAIGLLVVGFVGVRIFTTFVLRERYRDPVEVTTAEAFVGAPDQSWIIDETWLNSAGERISWDEFNRICSLNGSGQSSDAEYQQCLADNGLRYFTAYHPVERFYQFQAIETALYLGLAAGLLVFAYWWLTRRSA